jgi:5-methylcytosine-specific restriction protein B
MSKTASSLTPTFKKLLSKYVEDFIVRVTSGSTSQVPIAIDPAFSLACKDLNIWFKTSFGHGNLAEIPWLACFAPGQSAQLEGVYPVLLFQRSNNTASVNYGVSATAVDATGAWPREWPQELIAGLPQFALKKKKQYKQSFVAKEFVSPTLAQVGDIVSVLSKVIAEFRDLKEALANRPKIDFSTLTEFANGSSDAGLTFSDQVISRLISSLLTKRFCILTGLAGSGKTKLAEAFAMWLCESDHQYRIVAVGADWTSNENLLGYADALQPGQYRAPVNGVLELLLRATADQEKPYFLILDEMNLSHVERYFADFLSAMESDNAPLSLHGVAAGLVLDGATALTVPAELKLPPNLFIIGTVNVDETTYMFSPKVLDRANVIEFRATADQMAAFLDNPTGIDLKALEKQGVPFATAFVQRALADADIAALTDDAGNPLSPQFKSDLIAVFAALTGVGAEFGFRSAKEIARFMVIHKELSGPGWVYQDALDAQVLQKLMPKLHGSARKLSGVLKALEEFASTRMLPLSLEKIKRMQDRLERDGFTSFAEA